MIIIDKDNPEHIYYPPGLDGEVLLSEDNGYHTISPELLKYIAQNASPEQIVIMGHANHQEQLDAILTAEYDHILPECPECFELPTV